MTAVQINSIENLMLLCTEHHKLIDTKPYEYPIERLLEIKKRHEERIRIDLLLIMNQFFSIRQRKIKPREHNAPGDMIQDQEAEPYFSSPHSRRGSCRLTS